MLQFVRSFGFSLLATLVAIVAVWLGYDAAAVGTLVVLIAIEIALSFDNAVVNAKILGTLSPFWQRMFLTVGIVIAIFGMRVIFPVLIVMITAHESWHSVVTMALHQPERYAAALEHAHPYISAFGGMFLLMLTLHFFFDRAKEVHWLQWFERPARHYSTWWLPPAVSLIVLVIFAVVFPDTHVRESLAAGVVGVAAYSVMRLILYAAERVTNKELKNTGHQVGLAAFVTFLYLELLDASFSFDGVLGAFAITGKVVLIGAGLGVGALWVRSLTVYMVHRGMLETYRYLEHGAHYAVGALALSMLVSLSWNVPEVVIGITSLGLIGASLWASRAYIKNNT